jgi:uncharacterized membrane protein YfcA
MLELIFFGLCSGLALGLTGSGGSIIAVPLLMYGAGLNPHQAIQVSLASVLVTAALGAVQRGLKKEIDYSAAIIMLIGSIAGAPLGTMLNHFFSEKLLITLFAILMLVIGGLTWMRKNKQASQQPTKILPYRTHKLVLVGLVTGVLTGLFGVGGGFLIVPMLIAVGQLPIRRAMASSLFVISIASFVSLFSHFSSTDSLKFNTILLFTVGSIVGMIIGSAVSRKIPTSTLQRIFAIFVILIALYMLIFSK